MIARRFRVLGFSTLAALFVHPQPALPQATTGSIAGIVRDATGAVLPGVTVEASSPALIEKTRTVVTDAEGQYKIVDLRPGSYTVTFTLTGFSTVKREGLELNTGVTLPANADMKVGSLEETITVTGASPVVDVQNVRTQNVLTRDVLDVLPTAKSYQSFATMTVGASVGGGAGGYGDVGGTKGESVTNLQIHGTGNGLTTVDGMRTSSAYRVAYAHRNIFNQMAVQEVTMETSGASAETQSGGLNVNMVPKDGGNQIKGTFAGDFANKSLQTGSNLTDTLRARGLTRTNAIRNVYDVGVGIGGPIRKDKLWFFHAQRAWGSTEELAGVYYNRTQNSLFYTPDLDRPGTFNRYVRDAGIRLTWQATSRQKIAFNVNAQDYRWLNYTVGPTVAPEAAWDFRVRPNQNWYGIWSYPLTSKLLIEAGASYRVDRQTSGPQKETGNARPVVELSTGVAYGSNFQVGDGTYGDHGHQDAYQTRASISYITGSHALKFGMQSLAGKSEKLWVMPLYNVQYNFRNGIPVSLVQGAFPHSQQQRLKMDLGLFAQDQWTIKRLTLNLGLRFDHLNAYNPRQTRPAGEFTPEFTFDPVPNVPNWKDVSPRIGVAYDIFGNGRTAIKASVGRYVVYDTTNLTEQVNPARAISTTTTRTWNDANLNYVPDCDLTNLNANGECGRMDNQLFGQTVVSTRFGKDVTEGWFARPYNWQISAAVQHELRPGFGVTVGYFRTIYGNTFIAAPGFTQYFDNQAVTAADFNPYCITAPSDARLPGGGGYQVCGLYDVKPAKFGQVDNLVAQSVGETSRTYDGVDVAMNARFGRGGVLTGGISFGSQTTDACNHPDVPPQFCHNTVPNAGFMQVKLSGSYPLPWGLRASATYQNLPGQPVSATFAATNAQIAPSLGRNLAACPATGACTATVTVTILEPNTRFEARPNLVDFRLTRNIDVGRMRIQPRIDWYNLLNSSAIITAVGRYGATWLQPTEIFQSRYIKFGVQVDF